jgi:16S rRNA (guanine966-N2)-methyltransferase
LSLRVTGGEYRGRILRTVDDLSVRPATDRVRQSLFNMLVNRLDFEDLSVLDLFAGSGSLGIEALSRGAARAVFVEGERRAASYIESNIDHLGCAEHTEVLTIDAMRYIADSRDSFRLVFADPPYQFDRTPSLPELIFGRGLVEQGGYLLIEHTTDIWYEDAALYRVGPVKKFGRTVVTFFTGKASHEAIDRNLPGDV